MPHDVLRVLSLVAILLMVALMPALVILFTDRFRRPASPGQYAALLSVAAVAGIMLFLPAISIVAATALVALGLGRQSSRLALTNVAYQRQLTPVRLFVGDEADLVIEFENRKPLPLSWVTMTDPVRFDAIRSRHSLQDLLRFSGGIEILDNLSRALVIRSAVGPYQRMTRTYRVAALQRGVYTLGPVQIESGDVFGLFRQETILGDCHEIVVYPRVYRSDEIGLPFREALGNLATRVALVDDPTLLAGSREYRPGDPLRRIHWKSTAHTGDLQVRVCDPSTTAKLMIVLNLNTFMHPWQGVDPSRVESVISLGASFAVWALDRGLSVGLRSNGTLAGIENAPRVAASAHPRQSALLLDHLARLSSSGRSPAENVLLQEARRAGEHHSVVFVTSILTPSLIRVLTRSPLRNRVSVIYSGRHAAPVIPGLDVYLAVPPLDEKTRDVKYAVS